jgi:hypothetical protein
MRHRIATPALVALLTIPGCLSDEDAVCNPGDSQYCWCEADQQGMQTCDDDGMGWHLCDCDAPEDDDDGDDDDTVYDSGARLEISPSSPTLEQVEIGCVATDDLTLISVGQAPLEIYSVELQEPSTEITVTLDAQPMVVLPPGESAVVTVEYAPVDQVSDEAWLIIDDNDPTHVDGIVHIETSLADGQVIEEEFVQVDTPSVDVLWVLDNSSSMVEEQEFLKSVIPTFVDVAVPSPSLVHLGVVTTDGNHLLGNPNVLTTDMPDVFEAFSEVVAVGTSGSDSSQGLETGSEAITPPLAAPGGVNDGFLRDEAGLVVIFVSDEDDESPDTITAYVNLFQSLKVDPEEVYLIAVTGGAAGCQSAVAHASPESRYTDAADHAGGLVLSICDETWVEQLAGLPWEALGWAWTFELGQEPLVETIEVEVGGVLVTEGWSYDQTLNAVKFDETGLPGAGVGVGVRYWGRPDC